MNKILVGLLLAALNNKKVQDAAGDFVSRLVTQKLMPLLPVLAAAAAKAVTDQIPELANVADVAEVTDQVRQRLHEAIPDVDFGIPELDDVLDFWREVIPEMKFGLPPEAAVRAADELLSRLGLRKEFGVKERGEPEPTWLSDYRDLPVRDGETLMVRWKSEWKADTGG